MERCSPRRLRLVPLVYRMMRKTMRSSRALVLLKLFCDFKTAQSSQPTSQPTPLRGSFGSVGFNVEVLSNATINFGIKDVSAGDLNNDSFVDVLVAIKASNLVGYYLSQGGSGFGDLVTLDASVFGATDVLAVDLNGDGHLDVVASSYYQKRIYWYLNDGAATPSFTRFTLDSNVKTPEEVRAADIDGDGHMDLVAAASVRWGTGEGWGEGGGARRQLGVEIKVIKREVRLAVEGAKSM